MKSQPQNPRVALAPSATLELQAAAQRLGIPLLSKGERPQDGLVLQVEKGQLRLQWVEAQGAGPLQLDFAGADLRRRIAAGANQPIARAMGIPQGRRRVLDATTGLGRDAFLLASLGCQVRALERDPVLYLLLESALERAMTDPTLRSAASRLELIHGDAADWLGSMDREEAPEVIYLDPMFPEQGKSAKSKKEMQYLRFLLGDELGEGADLLQQARQIASHRVVVKRVHRAPALIDPELLPPIASVKSRLLRFDIYAPAPPAQAN